MHFLGFGKIVMNNGTMTLRTARSGVKGKSVFDPLTRVILAPMAKMAMRSMDRDGDGKLGVEDLRGTYRHLGQRCSRKQVLEQIFAIKTFFFCYFF